MAKDMGARQAELIHQGGDVGGHLAFGIGGMGGVIGRRVAVAVAAQIRDDDVEMPGQRGGHLFPAMVILREAVQQDQRRAAPGPVDGEADRAASDMALGETGDHGGLQGCRCCE